MKLFQLAITIGSIVASFLANAGEQPLAREKDPAYQRTGAELQPLQGTWEGGVVGEEAQGKITITITNDSFHFHRDTNFWFATTITLPAGTEPKQLRATIKATSPPQADSIGKVVGAIFKIEDGALTLATGGSGSSPDGTPQSFEATENQGLTRYVLRKVEPRKEHALSPKAK